MDDTTCERPSRLLVGYQVQVALAKTHLGVREAVPLLRQRAQGLGQQRERLGLHRDLARAGADDRAGHADPVSDVQVVQHVVGIGQVVAPQQHLYAAVHIHQVGERGLAHAAETHHPPGHRDRFGPDAGGITC